MEHANRPRDSGPPLRILSLDGGGIRGKSSLLILENIMENIRRTKGLDQIPRPCECFDLIGGTSTGGIIAIMLGRLGMTVDECIRAYDKVAENAFTPKWTPFPIAPPKGAFSAQALEAAIKQVVRQFCTEERCVTKRSQGRSTAESCPHSDLPFRSTSCTKTAVVAITKDNVDALPTIFSTYDTSASLQNCTIWEIARATSAATTFFKSIKLGRDQIEFIDAGFGYNNPCEVLINEARQQFPGRGQLQVLSIGTGLGDVVTIKDSRRSIIRALKSMATTSNKVAERLDNQYGNSGQYFRFNVDRGLEDITLSDWEKTSTISAHTTNYLAKNRRLITEFVDGFLHRRATQPEAAAVRRESYSTRAYFNVPFPKNKRFIGRSTILAKLKDMLFKRNCQDVALVGLGGIGKTQVALQIAHWVKETQPDRAVIWVPAISNAAFDQVYEEIARDLGIAKASDDEDIKELVRNYLSSEKAGKWLLIVDNADDMELLFGSPNKSIGISQYLPKNEDGLTLFTTRFREIAQSCAENDVVELGEMDKQEALSFLETSLDLSALAYDKDLAKELVSELTYLPLAIKQAVAYLNKTKLPISEYLKRLRDTEQGMTALMSKEFRDNFRYSSAQNAVATTWLVSFDQIRKSDDGATRLLEFISRIEPKAIPQSILPELNSEEQLIDAVGTLCAYAFLTRRDDYYMFDMHRLVHLGARIWIERHGHTERITREAIIHLEEVFSSSRNRDRKPRRVHLPHALRVLHESDEHDYKERFELFYFVGKCLRSERRAKECIWAYEEICQWAKEQLPEESIFRLRAEHDLGGAYILYGRYKKAIDIMSHVVAVRGRLLPETDATRVASEHRLARAYLEDNQTKEAIRLFKHVVAIRRKTLPENSRDRLTSEYELARTYVEHDRIEEAISMFEYIIATESTAVLEDDRDGLAVKCALAGAYSRVGRVDEAIPLLENIVAIEKSLPEDDRDRLTSMHQLAVAYLKDDRISKAISLFEHIVEFESSLPEDDRGRLATQHMLARAYLDDNRVDKAISLFERVVAIQKALPEEDPDRILSEHELGRAYLDGDRVRDAIEVLEPVMVIRNRIKKADQSGREATKCLLEEAYSKL
ncbi:acyl transferase/acyl hydrolase/lysophospholipase [Hypomontagnella monticulosa]|nr:acyl transferase/acyl hydrolase/lysophospholipase [Hypomontagnella monticulosa]